MRRTSVLSIISVFSVLLALASGLVAQDWSGRGRLEGRVVDQDGKPVADATVTLTLGGREGAGPKPITTKSNGRWGFLGLATGPWTVLIEADGFLVSEGIAPVNEYKRRGPLETVLKPADAATVASQLTAEQQAEIAAAQAKAEMQQALLDAGNQAMEAGNTAEAKMKFQELIDSSEGGAAKTLGLLGLARALYTDGNVDGAVDNLKLALENEPGNVPALKVISSILVDEGRQEEADVYIAQLPEGENIDPNAFLNQGIEKFNANDIEGAIAIFDRVVTDFPDMADAYYYRGLCHMNSGNSQQALSDFRKMMELEPTNSKAGEVEQFIEYLASQG